MTAIHRTFLTADGRKKGLVAPNKAMLGRKSYDSSEGQS